MLLLFEATKLLTSKGAKVIILSRNTKKVNKAIQEIKNLDSNADIEYIKLDLASLESVRNASEIIHKSVSKIDAHICNVAIAQIATQKFTVDGFESQLGVNYYGNFLLCRLLFDKNYHPNDAYSHSKLALMMFAYELQRRVKQQNK